MNFTGLCKYVWFVHSYACMLQSCLHTLLVLLYIPEPFHLFLQVTLPLISLRISITSNMASSSSLYIFVHPLLVSCSRGRWRFSLHLGQILPLGSQPVWRTSFKTLFHPSTSISCLPLVLSSRSDNVFKPLASRTKTKQNKIKNKLHQHIVS